MSAFEDRFYRENPRLAARIARNLSLLAWLAGGLFQWLWRGRKLRAAYRRARAGNQAVVLEDYLESGDG